MILIVVESFGAAGVVLRQVIIRGSRGYGSGVDVVVNDGNSVAFAPKIVLLRLFSDQVRIFRLPWNGRDP